MSAEKQKNAKYLRLRVISAEKQNPDFLRLRVISADTVRS
jgi:hypothetical protein